MNTNVNMIVATKSTHHGKKPLPMYCVLKKSVGYVKGDIRVTGKIHDGSWVIGTRTPLTNINGSLIELDRRTASAGVSVGSAEKIMPRDENPKAVRRTTNTVNRILLGKTPKNRPTITGGIVNIRPNMVDARISPINIVVMVIGLESNISSVLCLVSQGAIIGVTDEAVKKSVRVISEASPSFNPKLLPA